MYLFNKFQYGTIHVSTTTISGKFRYIIDNYIMITMMMDIITNITDTTFTHNRITTMYATKTATLSISYYNEQLSLITAETGDIITFIYYNS